MTRYTVVYPTRVMNQLAEACLEASDKNAVSIAAQQLEVESSVDASTKGRDHHEGLREIAIAPLLAYFTVSESDRVVEVARLRLL